MLSIELEFLLYDAKRLLRHLTFYCPVEYIVWYIAYILWKTRGWDYLFYLGKW